MRLFSRDVFAKRVSYDTDELNERGVHTSVRLKRFTQYVSIVKLYIESNLMSYDTIRFALAVAVSFSVLHRSLRQTRIAGWLWSTYNTSAPYTANVYLSRSVCVRCQSRC